MSAAIREASDAPRDVVDRYATAMFENRENMQFMPLALFRQHLREFFADAMPSQARTALEALPSEGRVKGNAAVQRVIDDLSSMSEDELTWFKMDQSELIGKLLACLAPTLSGGASPREFSPDEGLGKLEDWAVDTHSTASPILTYQTCSVIEGEQAYGVLGLVTAALTPEVETDKLLLAYEQGRRDALAEAVPVGEAEEWYRSRLDQFLGDSPVEAVPVGEAARLERIEAQMLHHGGVDSDDMEWMAAMTRRALAARPAEEPGEAVAWRDMASAPKDGTLLTLLVRPYTNDEHGAWTPFEDSADPQPTIGFNGLTNTEEDRWQFAGWCWSHDHIIEGDGEVIGWAPFAAPAEEPGEVERLTRERDAAQSACTAWQSVFEGIEAYLMDRIDQRDPADPSMYLRAVYGGHPMTPATEKAAPIPALLPCPFCGSSGDELMLFCDPDEGHDNSGPSRRIQCAGCNVEAPYYPTKAEAVKAWNSRADRASQEERIREDERARCLADVDYIRENIRFHQTPNGRKRFDIYDLDRALKNTCTLIRERITGEDEGKWTEVDPADAEAIRLRGDAS